MTNQMLPRTIWCSIIMQLKWFRLNDEAIMYPSIDWRKYLLNKTSMQTQHNLNISEEQRIYVTSYL